MASRDALRIRVRSGRWRPVQQLPECPLHVAERYPRAADLVAQRSQFEPVGRSGPGSVCRFVGDEGAAAGSDDGSARCGEQSDGGLGGVHGDLVVGRDLPVRGQSFSGLISAGVDVSRKQLGDALTRVAGLGVVGVGRSHAHEATRRLKTAIDDETVGTYRRNEAVRIKTDRSVVDMDRDELAGLDDCTAPLGDEQREALHAFWDRVICEEWGLASRPAPVDGAMVELAQRRGRRTARRATARIAGATRTAEATPGFGGEAA